MDAHGNRKELKCTFRDAIYSGSKDISDWRNKNVKITLNKVAYQCQYLEIHGRSRSIEN